MRVFRDRDEGLVDRSATVFGIGIAAGLALGAFYARTRPAARSFESELRERARTAVRRLRPARLHRLAGEQEELEELEDSVLNQFLSDPVLSERGIDVGAISPGIIELSGAVATEAETDRAVSVANAVAGVHTVVNRIEVESLARGSGLRTGPDERVSAGTFIHHESRTGGMGRRRQALETDPARPDDSQIRREDALAAADRDQWRDEGFAHGSGVTDERPEVENPGPTRFREDELDNQDPHGKHAQQTLDEQPQALNAERRVGEPPKPRVSERLRDAEVPLDESGRDLD